MAHVNQVIEWLDAIAKCKELPEWQSLSHDGRYFLEMFEAYLMRNRGKARANIVSPFTSALKAVFPKVGVEVADKPACVSLAPAPDRTCDLSLNVNGQTWILEIKTGLEFNSLGAAVLEGLAFKRKQPNANVMLLSLYSKARKGNIRETLTKCGVEDAIDELFILSSNAIKDMTWYTDFMRNVDAFFTFLRTSGGVNPAVVVSGSPGKAPVS